MFGTCIFGRISERASARKPPSKSELLASLNLYGLPSKIYVDPYYSRDEDVPEKPREYAGMVFRLKGGDRLSNLDDWQSRAGHGDFASKSQPMSCSGWEYASLPPSMKVVKTWLRDPANAQQTSKTEKNSQVRFCLWQNFTQLTCAD